MIDGLYQSVICFFIAYCLFYRGNAVTDNGLNIDDRERFGIYVGPAAVIAINAYILLNTYRWDWLMVLLVSISILLVWFWTGVYSAFKSSEYFYESAAQVFGQPSFWAITSLSVILSLMPRFCIKFVQKIYFPYDVDIVREQVRQGKFAYLDVGDSPEDSMSKESTTSSDIAKPIQTVTTHNARSQMGSDGTDFTRHRTSIEQPPIRPSMDRPRPSFDRMRASMDRIRPSFEQSNDFTSAALLTRMESSHSFDPIRSRRYDMSQ
jgi:phospholipid-translocating ATPase